MDQVKIIECPRDAWQGLSQIIPTNEKIEYLSRLLSLGFRHLDAVSFVSPKHVPQMADSEQVMLGLSHLPAAAGASPEFIGIVVNEPGLVRALSTPGVTTIGYPYSISAYFRRANANMSRAESRALVEKIRAETKKAGRDLVVYISMAFGNPYGDPWNAQEVVNAVDMLESSGVTMISLADTVGLASAEQIHALVSAVMEQYDYLEIGVHLHSRPELAQEKILAAYDAGCRRFDSVIGGLGGCPFAQDALVGNIPTERVLEALKQRDTELPRLKSLDTLLRASAEIGARYTQSHAAD